MGGCDYSCPEAGCPAGHDECTFRGMRCPSGDPDPLPPHLHLIYSKSHGSQLSLGAQAPCVITPGFLGSSLGRLSLYVALGVSWHPLLVKGLVLPLCPMPSCMGSDQGLGWVTLSWRFETGSYMRGGRGEEAMCQS